MSTQALALEAQAVISDLRQGVSRGEASAPSRSAGTAESATAPQPGDGAGSLDATMVLTAGGTGLQQFRLQHIQASLTQIEVSARQSRLGEMIVRSARIVARRTIADVSISSSRVDKFRDVVDELSKSDPELLQKYLALIELLDQKRPDALCCFDERVREVLRGESDAAGEEGAFAFDLSEASGAEERLRVFFEHVEIEVTRVEVRFESAGSQETDPLVLDLDGDGIEVTSVADGQVFDIDGDGAGERTAFVTGGDAFLALDLNQNGEIDDGSELFGDHFGFENGFQMLAVFDENGDGVINSQDTVFDQLLLWDGEELTTMEEAGIKSIGTRLTPYSSSFVNDNRVIGSSYFTRTNGTRGAAADLYLRHT